MKVTFDTNTLDKACRPERFGKDPNQAIFQKVHDALKAKAILGVYSVALLTIEGIIKADRAKVMAGAQLEQQPERVSLIKKADLPDAVRSIAGTDDVTKVTVEYRAIEPDRRPLHPEFGRRVLAAKKLGVRILKSVPRVGALQYTDPDGEYYVSDVECGELGIWLTKVSEVARAIEARGVGFAQVVALGVRLTAGTTPAKIWFEALDSANDIHDKRAVQRAFSEWADGVSVASHIAYGLDVFCTQDHGKRNTGGSILDEANRQWLTATYGTRFMSLEELAGTL